MADKGFNVAAARQAGYTDDEILQHLTATRKFDIAGAMNSGYSKAEIIDHLSGTAPAQSPQPAPAQRSQPTEDYSVSGFESYQAPPVGQLLSGAAKSVPGLTGGMTGFEQGYSPEELQSAQKIATQPQNTAEQAGQIIGATAQSLPWGAPAVRGAQAAGKSIGNAVGNRLVPSMIKERAGQLFNAVAEDAGQVPVTLGEKAQEAALRLMDMQKVTNPGSTINKFLNRLTRPNADPLTYTEARDFYSTLSEMSWGDRLTLNPKVQYYARNLVKGLKDDIGNAAQEVGRAADYYQAMGQYARAQRLKKAYMALPGVAYVGSKLHTLKDLLGAASDISSSVAP